VPVSTAASPHPSAELVRSGENEHLLFLLFFVAEQQRRLVFAKVLIFPKPRGS
jgi:hypothetical protein